MKKGLSFDRHVAVGAQLKRIRKELSDMHEEVQGAYPKSEPCCKTLLKLVHHFGMLSKLQAELHDHLVREHHPEFRDRDDDIYFS